VPHQRHLERPHCSRGSHFEYFSDRCGFAALSLHRSCLVQGFLRGFDQTVNLILDECHERVYSQTAGVEHVPLGLYIIRGDNVSVQRTASASSRVLQRVDLVTHVALLLSLAAVPSSARSTKTRIRRSTSLRCEASR
jgi:hypothetical protein